MNKKNIDIKNKFKMNRTKIMMENRQIRVFNGRGWVCPQENSLTGFLEPNFATLHAFYGFRFDIFDNQSQTTIYDDVPQTWDTWVNKGEGSDPLGCNFRDNFKKLIVSQDAYWEPGKYTSNGIFNNIIDDSLINIKLKSEIVTSHLEDNAIIKYSIKNVGLNEVDLKLMPKHVNTRTGKDVKNLNSINSIQIDDETSIQLDSNLDSSDGINFDLKLKSGEEKIVFTRLHFYREENKFANSGASKIEKEFNEILENTDKRIDWFLSRLPEFKSDNKSLENLYYKSMITMNECKWNRDDFLLEPFWSVGSWLFTIAWDTQFSQEAIGIMNPESLLDATWVPFTHGKMKKSWVGWNKEQPVPEWTIFYIQEPVSVMKLLITYLRYTNNTEALKEKRDGKTLVEWFKVWSDMFLSYLNKDNLIDIKDDTEILVEIRTKGYDYIVPNVNVIASGFMKDLSYLCKLAGDKDEEKFLDIANKINDAVETKMWDEENWWLSNIYEDGRKENVYAYHLFDSLGSELLSYEKKVKLMSHIKESEFLGKYGFFSISKQDEQHYDQIDADWGGGGQFAGMPGRIAHNAFKLGNSQLGYEILKKIARWTEVFPYQPQNARAEKPFIDLSSMAIQVSSGASIEAIIYGMFGIDFNSETITISPNYNESARNTSLKNLKIRNHTISIELFEDEYQLTFDDVLYTNHYGKKEKFKL